MSFLGLGPVPGLTIKVAPHQNRIIARSEFEVYRYIYKDYM